MLHGFHPNSAFFIVCVMESVVLKLWSTTVTLDGVVFAYVLAAEMQQPYSLVPQSVCKPVARAEFSSILSTFKDAFVWLPRLGMMARRRW
jgi:hypothetical protein